MESGIYKITNKITGKCYVGSTKDFNKRWKRHFKDLREGKHHSIKLQRSYNKYGEDVFVCEVVEEVPYTKDVILEREQFWINKLDAYEHGYNIGEASFGDTLTHNPNREKIIEDRRKTWHNNHDQMSEEERKEKYGKPGKLNGMYGRHRTNEEKTTCVHYSKGKLTIIIANPNLQKPKEKYRKLGRERG